MLMAQLLILALAQEEDSKRVPRNRITVPRCNAFQMNEEDFIKHFRLSKTLTFRLIEELKPFLEPKTMNKTALSPEIKVLCALNFFAFGSHQKNIGKTFLNRVSQSSVSSCIQKVSKAMSENLLKKYVKFPNDLSAQKTLKEEFYNYCGLEDVLGVIDCTHVAIVAPPDDGFHHERNYVNQKGWHSISTQLVCDMNLCILNACAKFPGCSEDAFIWQSSNLKRAFDSGKKIHGVGWLLGDSSYLNELHILTPYSTVSNGSSTEEYKAVHAKGWSVIEKCNAVLKKRFQCLLKQKSLHYMPEAACRIIYSCIILHNMCVEGGMNWEDIELPEEDELFDTLFG